VGVVGVWTPQKFRLMCLTPKGWSPLREKMNGERNQNEGGAGGEKEGRREVERNGEKEGKEM